MMGLALRSKIERSRRPKESNSVSLLFPKCPDFEAGFVIIYRQSDLLVFYVGYFDQPFAQTFRQTERRASINGM